MSDANRQERLDFVHLIWEVVYSDAKIDTAERSTVSLISDLLNVKIKEVVRLRKRVTD